MKKIFSVLFIIFTSVPFVVIAGKGTNDSTLHAKVTQWMSNTGIRFLENKGQMMDQQHKPVPNVLYEAHPNASPRDSFWRVNGGGMNVYVTTTGLSYVFVKLEKQRKKNNLPIQLKRHNDSILETYCRADMQLMGASIKKENIIQEGVSTNRTDYYYGGICPDGIIGVHSYSTINIKNIYPGIDWVLHGGKKGMKYDFIVHPGADPSQIKLKYKWTDMPQLQENGSVKISTPMGNITEGAPVSYCNSEQVSTSYVVKDSEIYFNISHYNAADTLIIDPTLVWATYYAGSSMLNGYEDLIDIQDDGTSVWLTGFASYANFPTLNPGGGAYFQNTVWGTGSVFIIQFNTAGVLEWSTYYGGSGYDLGWSIYSNGNHVWVTGETSSPDLPTYNPGGGAYYQPTLGSANATDNAFILQFSTTGVRQWATYYGGRFLDVGLGIHSSGPNIWVTGMAGSANFPTLNPGGGAYFQGGLGGGVYNAFILQFDTNDVRKWATFYGGNNQSIGDMGLSVKSTPTNIWLTGFTSSPNFPTYNPGGGAYYQGTPGTNTGTNAFVLQFSNTGIRKWATYLGGNDSSGYTEEGNSLYLYNNSVWITGTTGSNNFPTLNPGGGAYFQGRLTTKLTNVFISQFNDSGAMQWSTYYGGSEQDEGYSIQCDGSNIWLSGATTSPDFPTLKANCGGYYDSTIGTPGNQDVFILQFNKSRALQWSTYYGYDFENDDSRVWSDGSNLFVAGDVTELGQYPTVNPGGGAYFSDSIPVYFTEENVFIGKFLISGAEAGPNVSICEGSSTQLSASGGTSYSWSLATGLSATNIPNPVASPTVTATYTVTIVDTGACGGTFKDSVKVTVDTFNFKNIRISSDTTICTGDKVTLAAGGGLYYNWSMGATTSSITITDDSATATYTVAISNGTCIKDTGIKVTVASGFSIYIAGNHPICKGQSDTIFAIPVGVNGLSSYMWSTGSSRTSITVSPSSDSIYSVIINYGGCSEAISASVIVHSSATINVCCDSSIFPGQKVQLITMGAGNGYSYSWSPPEGLNCPACSDPIASPNQTTTYTVTVINDSTGCVSTGFVTIDVACADVFVPDVFAPNQSTYNNVLYVRSTCIATMEFEIFDRWGNKVFTSGNINNGWDGTYSGTPMNTGNYMWLLKATMKDGTTIKKSGNVTLVR